MDPIDSFLSWRDTLPTIPQNGMTEWIVAFFPTAFLDENEVVLDPDKSFNEWLKSGKDNEFHIIGKLLHIRSVIDFYVVRSMGQSYDWEEKMDRLSAMRDSFASKGIQRLADKMQDTLDELPETKRQWIDACKSWKSLRNGALSDESLEAYLQNANH